MPKSFLALLVFLLTVTGAGMASAQDDPVPQRRAVLSPNVDFFGADLGKIFDTTLEACEAACLADARCMAFTFNARAGACFPKSAVTEAVPYAGAMSGRVVETPGALRDAARARMDALSFLEAGDFRAARAQAESLGRTYPAGARTEAELIEAARSAEAAGDPGRALRHVGAALSLTDRADLWAEMARLALAVRTEDRELARRYQRTAFTASVNAYLRADAARLGATALIEMAGALERTGRPRATVPALKLAAATAPRPEITAALERARGLYGFRITEHRVESDLAAPRICAVFSDPLAPAGVAYGDFVQLPAPGLSVEAEGAEICVSGVEHGTRYRLAFREGLPARDGEALAATVPLEIYVRDRSPSARFPGRAYILPRAGGTSIPVVTVNLTEVDLALYRVDERNLLTAMRERLFARPLSAWDTARLADGVGEALWRGTGEVEQELNRDVTTRLPMGEVLAGLTPGIYALTAREPGADPQDGAAATQWFVVSDLGLATMAGDDGLHVFARSLATAEPVAGATAELIAVNNTVLGEAVTDAAGYARFDPGLLRGSGGAEPALVTLSDAEAGDMAFLDLQAAAFDLSDRGVAGRTAPPPIDVFLTTDRGAYRAGETVHATALARDGRAAAIADLPLTAVLTRPDGVEYTRTTVADQGAGGHVYGFDLGEGVPRGTWRLAVHADPAAPPLAATRILVEDFLPERIDFDLSLPAGPLRAAAVPVLDVTARYLYGAPGAGLAAEGETTLAPAAELADWPGYRFGRHDHDLPTAMEVLPAEAETGADGRLSLPLALPAMPEADRPLEMTAALRLREGSGRPVERRITRTVLPGTPMIGIRPEFNGAVEEGGTAAFRAIALDAAGARTGMDVTWVLNRVETRYQWYELYGNWNWEPVTTRTRVAEGRGTIAADAPLALTANVDWGRYELEITAADGTHAAASVAFNAGWYVAAGAADTPDMLEAGLDRESYAVGETARLRLVPRHAGKALVTVMAGRLIHMEALDLPEGETVVDLPVTDDWGPGAYVAATLIRPMDVAAGQNPARSLGLVWAPVDPGDRRLAVAFESAAGADPRGPYEAVLKIDGIAPGESAYATIAAVDLGILNLTGFEPPDPAGHYFGQRKLGMALRDVYGRLIDGLSGAEGRVRSGGDATAGLSRKGKPPEGEPVAFFSGPLTADTEGRVRARFDLPAFNGTVRLMAVAWSPRGVGQAMQDVLVRDPVVVTASLPRFLAPGDRGRLLLELAHASGPAGEMGLEVAATAGLTLDTAALPGTVTLAEGARQVLSLPVTAAAAGRPVVTVRLTTPTGKALEQRLALDIRRSDPEVARVTRFTLAPGATFTFDADVFDGYAPGSGHATLAAGPVARLNAPGLLAALDRYPYGCTEQVTSRAMPLLYYEEVARAMGAEGAGDIAGRIGEAVQAVLANQTANGAFGLWAPEAGDLWLDAYVTDFLSRARARGHAVPDRAFGQALDNLQNRVNYAADFERGGEGLAYALLVLAREGRAAMGDLRYYADVKAGAFATPMALAQLGAALAAYGDQTRADAMFRQAAARLAQADGPERPVWRVDYGTPLRDAAAVLTLAAEAGSEAVDRDKLVARIAEGGTIRQGSTQEMLWSLLAAHALIERAAGGGLTVDGTPVEGPLVRVLAAETAEGAARAITNTGAAPETLTLTTFGVPKVPPPPGGEGYAIERAYYTLDGAPADPARVTQNTRLVAVLTVTPHGPAEARLMVSDPLPAGFEIDNPNLLRAGQVSALDWLQPLAEPRHAEFLDDRFRAAVDWRAAGPFRLAYLVRAVSPGSYHHPAASVEDMYRPRFRAWGAAGRVTVAE